MGVLIPVLEVAGGLMLIAGLGTRLIALLLVGVLLVAAITAHRESGFDAHDGGWDYLLVLCVASMALTLTGPGRLGLNGLRARLNHRDQPVAAGPPLRWTPLDDDRSVGSAYPTPPHPSTRPHLDRP